MTNAGRLGKAGEEVQWYARCANTDDILHAALCMNVLIFK